MTDARLDALEGLRLDWVAHPTGVWDSSPFHVDGLHEGPKQAIIAGIADAKASREGSPIGLVIEGQRGVGKTHMLGWVRAQAHRSGGYFFLVSLQEGITFWESSALAVIAGLRRRADGETTQLRAFLRRLCSRADLPGGWYQAIAGDAALTRPAVDGLVAGIRSIDGDTGQDCQDTARAMALLASGDGDLSDLGFDYLNSSGEADREDRARWGIKRGTKPPQLLVQDVSRLLALTGPTVVAVDQIDTLVAQTRKRMPSTGPTDGDLLLDHVADGLMTLREVTRRTITVVTCLPQSWTRIENHAVVTVADRFRSSTQLQAIPSPDVGRDLVAKRLQAHYRSVPFEPPYPTWPIRPEAFDEAVDYTPRDLLIRVERHVDWCRTHRQVRELERLDDELPERPTGAPASRDGTRDDTRLAHLDERFAELRAQADITRPFDPQHEDTVMPGLLTAGLIAWKAELGEAGNQFEVDAPTTVTPDLHARLRLTVDAQTEDEDYWSFRSVASVHGTAQFNRVKAARKAAGVHPEALGRTLILIRNVKWTTGRATNRELATIRSVGGGDRHLGTEDVRTFSALATMITDRDPDLDAWLRERRPASGTEFLESVLGKVYGSVIGETGATDRQEPDSHQAVGPGPVPDVPDTVMLGLADQTREPVRVPLVGLRKHMAIFAGSGSGKTVFIRRLIEQCALQGVSAIVLDPNNDLARLGDAWPEPPSHWIPGDAARAKAYLDGTDVVVWTPGREGGRPLSFQPLPDFADVGDDRDEFEAAVDTAVATLAPRGGASGTSEKAKIRQAVLRQAVRWFGEGGGRSMEAFVAVLADLPEGVSTIAKARSHAAAVGTLLEAAMENDPVFGGSGQSADPGVLLTPPPGKRARVSVINFVGLPSDEQRQAFVNQLQMALFAWAKRNPAGDRPLGGLLVMDEAQTLAPSGELTACTKTTLMLASQARKYGLGLVFATQAPKALHNRVAGNATTQLFGHLNAPAQIEAANDMARAKGGGKLDISRLETAEFYTAREGAPFQKMRVPMCLSHHPQSPLTTDEVIERAKSADA